jgi:hypothetical protein
MVNLKIQFGRKQEVQRILATLPRLDWYKKHNVFVLLPAGINKKNASKIVEKDFNEAEYQAIAKELEEDFNKMPKEFFLKLEQRAGKKIPENITAMLTKYGCGGSYNADTNWIIINYKVRKKENKPIYCLKHELIHIMLEDEVQRKKLNQEEKEDLVNAVFDEITGL